jgi:putative nucleotidyltransferase with HDIG domain
VSPTIRGPAADLRAMPGPRGSIRNKIIAPFIVVVLFIGVFGTSVVMRQASDTAAAEFDSSLLRASLLANDHLALLETDRLAQLRAATDTVGVADAVTAPGHARLGDLLQPIQANAKPARIVIRVLDTQGAELLAIPQPWTDRAAESSRLDYAMAPTVKRVLAGAADGLGDRYLFLATEPAGPMLYWVGPIRGSGGQVVGAVLLGESLADITQGILQAEAGQDSQSSQLAFYAPDGEALITSLPVTPSLPRTMQGLVVGTQSVRSMQPLSGHQYGVLFTEWTMRNTHLGYLAVALPADLLEASLAQIKALLILVFVIAALLTLLIGGVLARRISRPIEQLVASTRSVAAGELSHRARVMGRDEIGYLASSFNDMTASLEAKTRALEESYFASMEALARAIDARDPSTFGHSARVAAISMEIAEAMHLAPSEREALRRAALLHDIGKIGVDDRILQKAGGLSETELAEVREHPMTGYEMLRGLPFLQQSLTGVRHHHERWDGTGYPNRLKGEAIPLPVRILSLADVFDAVSSKRPYKARRSFQAATQLIIAGAGTQFDPAVVGAFQQRADAIAELVRIGDRSDPDPGEVVWMEEAG